VIITHATFCSKLCLRNNAVQPTRKCNSSREWKVLDNFWMSNVACSKNLLSWPCSVCNFTCNFRMQHAFILAPHACAFTEHIQAFDLTEVNESEICVQQLAMEIIKLIRTHTWRVVYCLYTRVWSKNLFPTSKRRLCVSPIVRCVTQEAVTLSG